MPKMVCVKCHGFYHIKKNGVVIEEGMPTDDARPPMAWVPYKLWLADLWGCDRCGHELAVLAPTAFAHHYQGNYEKSKRIQPPLVFVDDC